jgi:hypothetical protein
MISCLYLVKLICLLSNALLQRLFLQLVLTRPQQGRRAHTKKRCLRRIQKTFTYVKPQARGLKFDNLRAAAMHINCFALHPCSNGNERWHVLGEDRVGSAHTELHKHHYTHPKCRECSSWVRSNYLTIVHSGGSNKQSHSPGSKLGEMGA